MAFPVIVMLVPFLKITGELPRLTNLPFSFSSNTAEPISTDEISAPAFTEVTSAFLEEDRVERGLNGLRVSRVEQFNET